MWRRCGSRRLHRRRTDRRSGLPAIELELVCSQVNRRPAHPAVRHDRRPPAAECVCEVMGSRRQTADGSQKPEVRVGPCLRFLFCGSCIWNSGPVHRDRRRKTQEMSGDNNVLQTRGSHILMPSSSATRSVELLTNILRHGLQQCRGLRPLSVREPNAMPLGTFTAIKAAGLEFRLHKPVPGISNRIHLAR